MIFCLGKVSSGRRRRRRPAPRVPPGPAALGGWGGEGAPRTPGVPPRSRGGRRRAQGEAPQEGVKGRGGEGKERTAAPGPLTTPPRPSHIGVPAPPARGGSWAGGPGSYTPRRDATALGGRTGRWLSWGPGGLGSAPPPLPAPACVAVAGTPSLHLGGSFAPRPGARQKAQPLAGVLSRLSSYQSRPAAAASLPPGRGLGLRLELRLGLRLRRVQQSLPAGKVRGGADGAAAPAGPD